MQGLIVILNPKSGSSGPDFRAQIEAALQGNSASYEIRETQPDVSAAELARAAAQEGATHIIAAGGDGTIMSVVNGLGREGGAKLSIIPGGTANLLATALGIPADPEKAVQVALTGQEQVLDLGECGDKLFALGLGLGLTEKLVSQASAEEKEKLGRLAYLKAMLEELGARPSRFKFQLDDNEPQLAAGVAAVVANAGDIGGGLHFAPDAKMDDGLLDLCILHRFYWRDFVRLIWRGLRGDLPEDRVVSFYQAKKIRLEATPPLDLQIDGEVVDMQTPLEAKVRPKGLRVTVPRMAEENTNLTA
jgi:YegS/Rv2252/BmrU family lipid kinase